MDGLVLVWDLDQTLVGWRSFNPISFTLNTYAIIILKEAFLAKQLGIVSTIMILSNNSHPEEAVDAIENEVGSKFDFIVARSHPARDQYQPLIKDLATVRRVIGYPVDANKVWLMDDMRHKMVYEGVHWIQIVKQANNPYGSGFHQDPDMTDYSPLQNAITASIKHVIPNNYTIFKGGRKTTNKQKHKQKQKQKGKQNKQYRSKKKNRTRSIKI